MSIDLQSLNEQLRELQPPSSRDRLIFEAVVVRQRGQCDVAAEHGISQPRVSQIVAEVGAWLDRSLPRARQNESTAGEMAVGKYVVEAQIDFLLRQTMDDLRESRKDKVTQKAGTRGDVNWTETTTEGGQVAKVGLINMALRLAQAKAKLAGVDVTGRTQREMALAEERQRREAILRGQESRARSQEAGVGFQKSEVKKEVERKEEVSQEEPLIKKSGTQIVAAKTDSAQFQVEQGDRAEPGPLPEVKEGVLKRLINQLRTRAACALWTEIQLREYAEVLWDEQYGDGEPGSAEQKLRLIQRTLAAGGETESVDPHLDSLPRGDGDDRAPVPSCVTEDAPSLNTARLDQLRRLRGKRRSPQARRREFLVPLAAG